MCGTCWQRRASQGVGRLLHGIARRFAGNFPNQFLMNVVCLAQGLLLPSAEQVCIHQTDQTRAIPNKTTPIRNSLRLHLLQLTISSGFNALGSTIRFADIRLNATRSASLFDCLRQIAETGTGYQHVKHSGNSLKNICPGEHGRQEQADCGKGSNIAN